MPTQPLETTYYMACLNLTGERVVVVGAGHVAAEKIGSLLECGARVTVVAPEAVADVAARADAGAVEWVRRSYESSDLQGALLVIAATGDESVDRRVSDDARRQSILVNVADVPSLCNFILPAIVREGPITVGVSTSGTSPALAKRLRSEIGSLLGPEHAQLAQILNELRDWVSASLPTYGARKRFFDSIVNARTDPVALLRDRRRDELDAMIEDARRRAIGAAHGGGA